MSATKARSERSEGVAQTSLWELARLFLKLGTIAFGGPAAHIAMMEDEVVRRRRWLTREKFLDLLGATNLIPGPNSTEMAIHIGYHRAGWAGLIVAGSCFILPAALIVTAFKGAKGHHISLTSPFAILIQLATTAGTTESFGLLPLFLFFLKVGSVLFGSGYVLLAFLRSDLVERWHWLTNAQLLDAIAVGQITPGPVHYCHIYRLSLSRSERCGGCNRWNFSSGICVCRD